MLEVTRKNPFIFYVFFNKEKFQVDTSNIHVNLKVHRSQCPNSSTLDFCSESSVSSSTCIVRHKMSENHNLASADWKNAEGLQERER